MRVTEEVGGNLGENVEGVLRTESLYFQGLGTGPGKGMGCMNDGQQIPIPQQR